MIDDRLVGEDKPVDREYACPSCEFKATTDTARLCPHCGVQMDPIGDPQ